MLASVNRHSLIPAMRKLYNVQDHHRCSPGAKHLCTDWYSYCCVSCCFCLQTVLAAYSSKHAVRRLVLVPRRPGLREVTDLPPELQQQLWQEVAMACQAIQVHSRKRQLWYCSCLQACNYR